MPSCTREKIAPTTEGGLCLQHTPTTEGSSTDNNADTSENGRDKKSMSAHVDALLYLSEGGILGASVLLFSTRFASDFLLDAETGSYNLALTVFDAFTLLLVLFFLPSGQ